MILVYDITNKESFENLAKWEEESSKYMKNKHKIIVGNKTDLNENRKVSFETASEYAQKLNYPYIETSAKENSNVERIFFSILKEILKNEIPLLNEINFLLPPRFEFSKFYLCPLWVRKSVFSFVVCLKILEKTKFRNEKEISYRKNFVPKPVLCYIIELSIPQFTVSQIHDQYFPPNKEKEEKESICAIN